MDIMESKYVTFCTRMLANTMYPQWSPDSYIKVESMSPLACSCCFDTK
uniref:Uncharacterized protein n=1 Tax=Rhizophora mucronata TaxID=61149 RepID=A0A2P2NGV2_RHIMU